MYSSSVLPALLMCASTVSAHRIHRRQEVTPGPFAPQLRRSAVRQNFDRAAPKKAGASAGSDKPRAPQDTPLARQLELSMEYSDSEEVSKEHQAWLDDAPNQSELERRWGIGAFRKFSGFTQGNSHHNFAAQSRRGYHTQNEDFLWWVDTVTFSAFAVFDGHGGPEAAGAAATEALQQLPTRWLQWAFRDNWNVDESKHALVSWLYWNSFFLQLISLLQRAISDDAPKNGQSMGTTAAVVVVDKPAAVATVMSLGDSQILHARRELDTNGRSAWKLLWFSPMHHCDQDTLWEQRKSNATSCRNKSGRMRVCYKNDFSCIAVTRALGDKLHLDRGSILDAPMIERVDVLPGDVLLVASDGLWDVLPADEVIALMNSAAVFNNTCGLRLDSLELNLTNTALDRWEQRGYADDTSIVAWCAPADIGNARSRPRAKAILHNYIAHNALPDSSQDIEQSWWRDGGIGDHCVVGSTKVTKFFHRRWVRQNSTCGTTRVVKSSVNEIQQLTCYARANFKAKERQTAGDLFIARDGGSTCQIPRRKYCQPELPNGGCRPGTSCKKGGSDYICKSNNWEDYE